LTQINKRISLALRGDSMRLVHSMHTLRAATGRAIIFLRTLIFKTCFVLNTALHMLLCLPVLAMPRGMFWMVVHSWIRFNHWLLRAICGIDFQIDGAERIPPGPLLVASKHQSAWEAYALVPLFRDPTFVLKRELMWLPIGGWYLLKGQMIPVRRGAGSPALAAMVERAKIQAKLGRQIVIFPEGTRRPPDADPAYKNGISRLYENLRLPCVPVALNSGLYWPRRSWFFQRGTIRVRILDPIPPGLDRASFLRCLQDKIEQATARLVHDGRLGARAGRYRRRRTDVTMKLRALDIPRDTPE